MAYPAQTRRKPPLDAPLQGADAGGQHEIEPQRDQVEQDVVARVAARVARRVQQILQADGGDQRGELQADDGKVHPAPAGRSAARAGHRTPPEDRGGAQPERACGFERPRAARRRTRPENTSRQKDAWIDDSASTPAQKASSATKPVTPNGASAAWSRKAKTVIGGEDDEQFGQAAQHSRERQHEAGERAARPLRGQSPREPERRAEQDRQRGQRQRDKQADREVAPLQLAASASLSMRSVRADYQSLSARMSICGPK